MMQITNVATSCLFFLFCLLKFVTSKNGNIPDIRVEMPPSHIALSGDFRIDIISQSFLPLIIQLSRLEGNTVQILTVFPIHPKASPTRKDLSILNIPCGYFSKGGQYYIQIKKQPDPGDDSDEHNDSEVITRVIDVRWPMPQLFVTPENVKTYPQNPVTAILTFAEVKCPPMNGSAPSAIPEFWLQLHYCGHSLMYCGGDDIGPQNQSTQQILYSQQVRGLPGRSVFQLSCELFGLSGHYGLHLRPTGPDSILPRTSAYVKVEWSEEYVFNVHAHSIFPCDQHGGGVRVLFQYPSCILETGDRVRLFGRLRANVLSLAPPTSLEYISEQKVTRGQHNLHFECDLFTEHYVEYCFVYVSQSVSGAVSDVREDCVPTMPVSDQERGGWGEWSQWTTCSSTCVGGVQSRYRLCDSPPPRYGAQFCEGPAVEKQPCENLTSSWECFNSRIIYGNEVVPAEIPEIKAEIGSYCRCGCVVHLGQAKPRRIVATSSQSCPGRSFWLIQADDNYIIQFRVEQFYLPCGNQWLKIRDGTSLSSILLADLTGQSNTELSLLNSTGKNLLLEFYSDKITDQICGGGFLAEARQLRVSKPNATVIHVAESVHKLFPDIITKLSPAHIAAVFFISGLLITTILLGIQYAFKYRKYHIAEADDLDSLAASNTTLPLKTRVHSNSTLLSEIISLTRMRPINLKNRKNKHNRLNGSIDFDLDQEGEVSLTKEDDYQSGSVATLTGQNVTEALVTLANPESDDVTPNSSLPSSPMLEWKPDRAISMVNEKNPIKKNDNIVVAKGRPNQSRTKKSIMLTNVSDEELCSKSDPGCYSSPTSLVSTATIKSTNAKATKDKRNRERLLTGPSGSEFSIVGQDNDLEMDYYDYNVVNAGAAPGSYLGMDPAFLVWIPPLDEIGEILPQDDDDKDGIELTDIRPKVFVDPGSNKESPEEEALLPKTNNRSENDTNPPLTSPLPRKRNRAVFPLVHGTNHSSAGQIDNKFLNETECLLASRKLNIPFHEFSKKFQSKPDMEKETMVEKSPTVEGNALDKIRFADDDSDELDLTEMSCNLETVT